MIYKKLIRTILFERTKDDPEIAHEWTIKQLQIVGNDRWLCKATEKFCRVNDDRLDQKVFGLRFPNPVGLAAGFDKNGQAINGLTSLGFGFITAGTVTPFEQKGNDRPRIFRLPENRALINRMGFNNSGATALALRLSISEDRKIPIGASIGKMKDTPIEKAVDDYLYCLRALYKFADYFEINISSPNTAGLRALQYKSHLEKLLSALNDEMTSLAAKCGGPFKPMIPKIAPDVTLSEINEIVEVILRQKMPGIIAANTSIERYGLKIHKEEIGGLSGEPLRGKARRMTRYIFKNTEGSLPIISSGGIFSAEDAYRMFEAGASMVQILTGLVYEGPFLARRINRGLVEIFDRERISSISEINKARREKDEKMRCMTANWRECYPISNSERRK